MKIYTIAELENKCFGHGDYAQVANIKKDGIYRTGKYPPCFLSKELAEKYLETMEYKSDKIIVELELIIEGIMQLFNEVS